MSVFANVEDALRFSANTLQTASYSMSSIYGYGARIDNNSGLTCFECEVLAKHILHYVLCLPTKERAVISLLFAGGKNISQAAHLLKIDRKTVRSRRNKGLTRLARDLKNLIK